MSVFSHYTFMDVVVTNTFNVDDGNLPEYIPTLVTCMNSLRSSEDGDC
jgi:hypothetical protein